MTPAHGALTAATGLLTALCGLTTPAAAAAPAHPLGNFTVNYHTGLTLQPDRIDATVIVDRAEIAALQERPLIDTDNNEILTGAETTRYARGTCTALAEQLDLHTPAGPARWNPKTAQLTWEPGEAGLKTSRLTCAYTASAPLERGGDISVDTRYDTNRIGWREITAKGIGLRITGTELPTTSPTQELRRYPPDPLASPLDQRTAELHTTPSNGATDTTTPAAGPAGTPGGRIAGWFDALVSRHELTLPVGLLALLLAITLGASHALLPGHGKTIMAAYLAGRRGTRRDAVTVGATVTLTHTAGVLVLGLALPTATHLAGETVLAWLGTASGLIITAIGLWLLTRALRNKPAHGHHHRHHRHHHDHDHHHGRDHHHDHDHDHGRHHEHGVGHHPAPPTADRTGAAVSATASPRLLTAPAPVPASRRTQEQTPSEHTHAPRPAGKAGLIGMGIAGGLVPSPSALVVLLGAVALGRTAFGVLLVLAYGLGMAATLTLAGLLLLHVKHRIKQAGDQPRLRRLVGAAACIGPVGTSALVVVVGLGLTVRALTP
ncbi:sulfite exporter TauE/SafE family protein [Streptomyces sp. CC208A]|uniref:HoxN/HupN/NixA family nickel/cobalt transporter n=1 Tax=Streptomyces sp. CC208A TaxID=3044573 RepID=UPI0024A7BFCF|nr:sulfite exporter TauE/SafE family protein [Streptomyces sp. CC208A]